jgi:2'-5' RNA ligase
MDLPRLFIAIPIPEPWRSYLADQVELLQLKLPFRKWVHPEDYHITLKFLGEATADQIYRIQSLLTCISQKTKPFDLRRERWGTFGPPAAPSVLWTGVGGDLVALKTLQQYVDQMEEIGFPKEARPFHPHLTLARRYNGKEPFVTIKTYLPEAGGPESTGSVNGIILYQTHLRRQPMYESISSFAFMQVNGVE